MLCIFRDTPTVQQSRFSYEKRNVIYSKIDAFWHRDILIGLLNDVSK